MRYTPHTYQDHATQHIIDNNYSGLFLEMGLGKTVSTLTAVNRLLYDYCTVNKVLVVAPKRVAENTWTDERDKWDHLKGLRMVRIMGDERRRKEALKVKADIYIVSWSLVAWLVTHLGGAWPFDMIVLDELSWAKSSSSARFKALKRIRPLVERLVGLTGTPASNGLIDLWAQLYLIDQGERLGKFITGYREAYFKEPYRVGGRPVGGYKLAGTDPNDIDKNPNAQAIFNKIKDICISMKAADWLDMPELIDVTETVKLPPDILKQYLDFERDKVLEMMDDTTVTAINAAALANKLIQFANGFIYINDKHEFVETHNEKIYALEETVEAANGNPMLVSYLYQADIARINKHLKHLKPKLISTTQDIRDWNAGKLRFALGHTQSIGHGLNLQDGGHLLTHFGLPWGLEYYQQFVTRIHRQGQVHSVINKKLLTEGTIDFKVQDALAGKSGVQNALMDAVKALIKKYRG